MKDNWLFHKWIRDSIILACETIKKDTVYFGSAYQFEADTILAKSRVSGSYKEATEITWPHISSVNMPLSRFRFCDVMLTYMGYNPFFAELQKHEFTLLYLCMRGRYFIFSSNAFSD